MTALLCVGPAAAQDKTHAEWLKQAVELKAQVEAVEAKVVEPDASDLEAYKELVGKPDSGVIRLRSRPNRPDKTFDLLTIRGGGAYYSFARLTHQYGQGSDIELQGGMISVGFAGADYGWIAELDVDSLDAVSLENERVAVLASRKVPTTLDDVRVEQRRAMEGFRAGTLFCRQLPVEVGKVYALRSISYRTSDVLVCVKAHRQDDDGSMIFAWKLLKRFDVPTLSDGGNGGGGGGIPVGGGGAAGRGGGFRRVEGAGGFGGRGAAGGGRGQ